MPDSEYYPAKRRRRPMVKASELEEVIIVIGPPSRWPCHSLPATQTICGELHTITIPVIFHVSLLFDRH
jgi:hypothetical protein